MRKFAKSKYLHSIKIDNLGDENYRLTKPIKIDIHKNRFGYTVDFEEGNIASFGQSEEEAMINIKSLIVDYYDGLNSSPLETLDPKPLRQKKVLDDLIEKVA